jgi:hypothetical protein
MASRGAPPFKKSGLYEFELQQEGVHASASLLTSGSAKLRDSTLELTDFYKNATGAASWSLHSSGLYGWKCSETATNHNLERHGTAAWGFPLYAKYNTMPLAASRFRRYVLEAVLHRESIAVGGAFEFGVGFAGCLEKGYCGIMVRSVDTIYDGNWHVGHRFQTDGSITAHGDSGIAGDGDPVHARLEYLDGPTRSMVVTLDGTAIATFADADLPAAGVDDHDPSGVVLGPAFGAAATGVGTASWCLLSRYAVDRLD